MSAPNWRSDVMGSIRPASVAIRSRPGPGPAAWPPALVVASAAAFLVSETVDLAVYTPLQRRNLVLAVLLSGLAGLVVDSVAFLWIAFGDLSYLPGQVLGKLWMILLALPLVAWLRRADARRGIQPA